MFAFFTEHEFMPCERCGAPVPRAERHEHVCEEARRVDDDFVRIVRDAMASFEDDLSEYLATPEGRFLAWYAERRRGRAA